MIWVTKREWNVFPICGKKITFLFFEAKKERNIIDPEILNINREFDKTLQLWFKGLFFVLNLVENIIVIEIFWAHVFGQSFSSQ